MNLTNTSARPTVRAFALVAGASALVAVLATLGVLAAAGLLAPAALSRQAVVRERGGQVMPFDLSATTHIFDMTETGGVQRVIVKDPRDTGQIALVQQHVQHEAQQFRAGNFADPARLHGPDMPGLHDLAAGASRITVTYTALPDGAQLTYTTPDAQLVTAIHEWFGAQLSDHGQDAMSH